MPAPTYSVGVEFVAGSFTEVGSDCWQFTITRARADAFLALRAGRATLILDNADRRYSPANSAGIYAPHLRPNKAVRIQATYSEGTPGGEYFHDRYFHARYVHADYFAVVAAGTTYDLFRGFLDSITVDPELGRRTATLRVSDRVKPLEQRALDLPLFTDIPVGSLFTNLLSASGVSAADRTVDATLAMRDVVPFAWYQNMRPTRALSDLLKFGYAYAVIEPAGRVKVKDRYWAFNASVVATYSNAFLALSYGLDESGIINIARVQSEPRKKQTAVSSVAWIEQPIAIGAQDAIGFFLDYVDPETHESAPATEMVSPVNGTDYLTNTQSEGAGVDKTALASAQVTFFGASAVCSVYNGDAAPVFLTRFVLRGKSIPKQPKILSETRDASSQATYGDRPFTMVSDFIGRPTYAQDYADFLILERREPLAQLQLTLKNVFPDVLARDLGDLIHLVESHAAIGSNHVVAGLAHTVTLARGLEHRVTYDLEFAADPQWLVLDDAVRGKLDSDRRLAF